MNQNTATPQGFPRLYPIIDKATLDARGIRVACFAREMARAGVGMAQYRDKAGSPEEVLRGAAAVSEAFAGTGCLLVMNDRADLAVLAGWPGVHVGHKDMSACAVRRVLSGDAAAHASVAAHPSRQVLRAEWGTQIVVGVSTHNDAQVVASEAGCADYVAVGPVFATSTKADAEPVIALEGVRRARALTRKPIVAIGGITLENARSVIEAGADSVAVIGGLFMKGVRPGKVAEDFLAVLR
jgi:thiamine-phosphate pyrophosphorylase